MARARRVPGAVRVAQGGFEGGDVRGDRLGVEPDRGAVGDQHGARRRTGRLQALAEEGDGHAQGSASGGEVGVGPEQLDEGVAKMGALGIIGQVGEQDARLLAAEAGEDLSLSLGLQGAQKCEPPSCSHCRPREVRAPRPGLSRCFVLPSRTVRQRYTCRAAPARQPSRSRFAAAPH